jgi:hypothetical protein
MKTITFRIVALLTATILCFVVLPMGTAFAEDSVTVWFSATNANGNGFLFARQELVVYPGTAARFGYDNDSSIGEDEVTAMDALVAAHIEIYGEDKERVNAALKVDEMFGFIFVDSMFDVVGGITTFVEGVQPNDGIPGEDIGWGSEYGGYAVTQAKLYDGDVVEFFFTIFTETYAWFEIDGEREDELTVTAGESFDLAVMGYPVWMGMRVTEDRLAAIAPIEGAEIVLVTLDDNIGSFGEPIAATDENGVAAMSFDIPGVYYISAMRTEGHSPILFPWLKVTVEPAARYMGMKFVAEGIGAVEIELNRAEPVTVFVAVYNEVDGNDVFYAAGHRVFEKSGWLDLDVPLPEVKINTYIKVMIWEDLPTMNPVVEATRFSAYWI